MDVTEAVDDGDAVGDSEAVPVGVGERVRDTDELALCEGLSVTLRLADGDAVEETDVLCDALRVPVPLALRVGSCDPLELTDPLGEGDPDCDADELGVSNGTSASDGVAWRKPTRSTSTRWRRRPSRHVAWDGIRRGDCE